MVLKKVYIVMLFLLQNYRFKMFLSCKEKY